MQFGPSTDSAFRNDVALGKDRDTVDIFVKSGNLILVNVAKTKVPKHSLLIASEGGDVLGRVGRRVLSLALIRQLADKARIVVALSGKRSGGVRCLSLCWRNARHCEQ